LSYGWVRVLNKWRAMREITIALNNNEPPFDIPLTTPSAKVPDVDAPRSEATSTYIRTLDPAA
jgi:hypothetical protein